jgi:putative protein kinase ArgK-like GTPase of G3E family
MVHCDCRATASRKLDAAAMIIIIETVGRQSEVMCTACPYYHCASAGLEMNQATVPDIEIADALVINKGRPESKHRTRACSRPSWLTQRSGCSAIMSDMSISPKADPTWRILRD